jgi:hypothetical protein
MLKKILQNLIILFFSNDEIYKGKRYGGGEWCAQGSGGET